MRKPFEFYRCVKCLQETLEFIEESKFLCLNCRESYATNTFPIFIDQKDIEFAKLGEIYPAGTIVQRYRNFLSWLMDTFKTTESEFRNAIFGSLEIPTDARVLVTGAGTGEDIKYLVVDRERSDLKIHFQDASEEMITFTAESFVKGGINFEECNVSNASNLPYQSNYFDSVIHFGGINYFGEKKLAIDEMFRVCKPQGQILFGDEGVAPWLRNHDYGKMMIVNNSLWSAHPPLELLPDEANHLKIRYILENCFYVVSLIKDTKFPNVNVDVVHKSPRGGSIRTRWLEHQRIN